ncbi:MAG TPA: hypothetical protein VMT22_06760 [Terriglobales bacterium]|nr:hypothetical protein [Terriglobales bacterium]
MIDPDAQASTALANRIMDLLDGSGESHEVQVMALVMITALGGRNLGMTPEMIKNAMVTFLTPQIGELPANVVSFRKPEDGA